jgi:hypothetical protein
LEDSSAVAHRLWLASQIREAIPEGSVEIRVVIQKLRAQLEETEPERFAMAIGAVADEWMRDVLTRILRSTRSKKVWNDKRAAVLNAATSLEATNDYLNQRLRFSPYKDGTYIPLGKLTKEEALLVATMFAEQSKQMRLRAAVLKALARRCKDGQVIGDVTTNEEIEKLWPGLNKEED